MLALLLRQIFIVVMLKSNKCISHEAILKSVNHGYLLIYIFLKVFHSIFDILVNIYPSYHTKIGYMNGIQTEENAWGTDVLYQSWDVDPYWVEDVSLVD